jgi:1,4-alpha-glucan branching enzyme
MVEDALILSFSPAVPARFVGVRFANESWAVLHPCALNENGVFVLDYPVPEGLREIRYRVVVDGQWMADPLNPAVDTDVAGTQVSVFTLDSEPARPVVNPRVERDGSVTFVYQGTAGRRVSIVGDFNNWDPFMDYLSEGQPGSYSVTLRMPAGVHWYYFVSDGRRILDRFNAASATDPDGAAVSTFTLPS